MFGWFSKKNEVKRVEEDTKHGFEAVKKDITAVSGWIKHLDSEKRMQQKEIEEIKEVLSSVQEEVEGLKNVLSIMNDLKNKRVFKTPSDVFNKQTAVYGVQTGVQTDVDTPNFEQFSTTERAILWVLINSDMKLSYEDLSTMLGKEKSTIRGQINRIKQKTPEMIEEQIEKNGKKRVFIPDKIKSKMLKRVKVRIKPKKEEEKLV
ncbi:hypothetical protein HYT23_06065 [Candidatus Pacearchaeota archaeon]|nr:hypothetical protein [Candidatus Pacearchaeota archaeon]